MRSMQEKVEGTICIEYIGQAVGAKSYQGPSGKVYRFSISPINKRAWMPAQDAAYFLRHPEFRRCPDEALEKAADVVIPLPVTEQAQNTVTAPTVAEQLKHRGRKRKKKNAT